VAVGNGVHEPEVHKEFHESAALHTHTFIWQDTEKVILGVVPHEV
jgi:hypothetical protein